GVDMAALHGRPHHRRGRQRGRRGQSPHGRPERPGPPRRSLPALLGRRAAGQGVLPGRGAVRGSRRRRSPRGPRPGGRPRLPGARGCLTRQIPAHKTTAKQDKGETVMSVIRRIFRRAALLAVAAAAFLASGAAIPAFAKIAPPLGSSEGTEVAPPPVVHTVTVGGTPGWQVPPPLAR